MSPKMSRKPPSPEDPAVVLTNDDLIQLSKVARRNITDKESLFASVILLNTVRVEGVDVALEPRLLQRLKTRCLDKEAFPGWLREVIVKQLHDYAGW